MDNLNCSWAYNDLFVGTRNNVAQCCMQGRGWESPDWSKVDDLNNWYANFAPFVQVREQHKNNIQNKECTRCWKYENRNIASPRTRTNSNSIDTYGKVPDIPEVKNIELRFSNKCNLRCRMCDAASSSQIMDLTSELLSKGVNNSITKDMFDYKEVQNIDRLLELILQCDTVKEIQIAGGEPFLMPEVEWLLHELVKRNKTHINMKFITNLTSTKPRIINLLNQFDRVDFDLSIDGVGKTIEYQRYPVKWNTVEKNFLTLYEQNKFHLKFTPCLSNLNLEGLPDLINWARSYPNVRWGFNLVNSPSYMDYRLIPVKYRKNLYTKIENIDISFMPVFVREMYEKFFSKDIFEFREITEEERKELKDASEFWDYKSQLKFKDTFLWADELLA